MDYFFSELRRGLCSRRMLFSMAVCIVCLIIAGNEDIAFPTVDFLDVMMSALTDSTYALLVFLFPVLVCIPFSLTWREEVESGYYYLAIGKLGEKKYRVVKAAVNVICGIFSFLLPCIVYYLAILAVKGTDLSDSVNHAYNFWEDLREARPVLYGWVLVLNTGVCGAVFSSLGLGISTWVPNKYVACLLPLCFYIFSGAVLIDVNPYWNAVTLYSLNEYNATEPFYILIYDVLLFTAGLVLFVSGDRRYRRDAG